MEVNIMKNEKVMSTVLEMVQALSPEHLETFARDPFRAAMLATKDGESMKSAMFYAAELFTQATADAAPKGTQAGAVKACKGMFKYLEKNNKKHIAGAWVDADGRQCVCDGFRAARLRDPLPGLPAASQPWEGLGRVFSEPMQYFRAVMLPTAAEVVGVMALQRLRDPHATRYTYDFGPGLPRVDASYLLDMMNLFPGVREIRIADGSKCKISPLLWADGHGNSGILLPVRKPKGEE